MTHEDYFGTLGVPNEQFETIARIIQKTLVAAFFPEGETQAFFPKGFEEDISVRDFSEELISAVPGIKDNPAALVAVGMWLHGSVSSLINQAI